MKNNFVLNEVQIRLKRDIETDINDKTVKYCNHPFSNSINLPNTPDTKIAIQ